MGAGHSLGLDIDPESIALGEKTIIDLIGLNQPSDVDVSNINFIVGDINQYNSISELLNDKSIQSDEKYDKLIEYYNSNSLGDDSNLNNSNDGLMNGSFDEKDFKFATLFQNPPFGSQERGTRHADRKFMEFAMASAEVIYSFHMASTKDFLIKYYADRDLDITHIFGYEFPIPKIYDFHTKERQNVDVIVIRAEIK